MIARFIFYLKCVWYFRRTPDRMDRLFSDILLSIDEFAPTTILDYMATANGGTNIILSHETNPDLALNYSMGLGLNIARELETMWIPIYSRSKSYVTNQPVWLNEIRRILKLKLKCKVRRLPMIRVDGIR